MMSDVPRVTRERQNRAGTRPLTDAEIEACAEEGGGDAHADLLEDDVPRGNHASDHTCTPLRGCPAAVVVRCFDRPWDAVASCGFMVTPCAQLAACSAAPRRP